MAYKLNVFTGNFDYYENYFKGVRAAAPSSPSDGWTYIDSTTNGYYIYYSGQWQLLATLTAGSPTYVRDDSGNIVYDDSGNPVTG